MIKKFSLVFALIYLCGCQSITNSLAFHPDTVNTIPRDELPANVQELFIETSDQETLQSYFIPSPDSNQLLIYFHGNGGNISQRLDDLLQLNKFKLNVLGISYRGYGTSTGSPSESGVYSDGQSALVYATKHLKFAPNNIFILGRSIGSTVAINTAQNKTLAGLILVTPLTSGADQARAMGMGSVASIAGSSFNNIAKAPKIICPVLLVHGSHDSVIPLSMGQKIYQAIQSPKQMIIIEGADHNDLSREFAGHYWPPIYKFIKSNSRNSLQYQILKE